MVWTQHFISWKRKGTSNQIENFIKFPFLVSYFVVVFFFFFFGNFYHFTQIFSFHLLFVDFSVSGRERDAIGWEAKQKETWVTTSQNVWHRWTQHWLFIVVFFFIANQTHFRFRMTISNQFQSLNIIIIIISRLRSQLFLSIDPSTVVKIFIHFKHMHKQQMKNIYLTELWILFSFLI